MEFVSNEGKRIEIEVEGETYLRHAIKTRFVTQNDNYIDIIKQYVSDIYQEGDIISISEKIISLCQKRVIKREEIKVGFWAKTLSKFASHPSTGIGVGESIKMQYAINKVGLPHNPDEVCNEIKKQLEISCMIVDSNDLGQEILGKSNDIRYTKQQLKGMIKDNPAGQGKQRTPIILIRKKY